MGKKFSKPERKIYKNKSLEWFWSAVVYAQQLVQSILCFGMLLMKWAAAFSKSLRKMHKLYIQFLLGGGMAINSSLFAGYELLKVETTPDHHRLQCIFASLAWVFPYRSRMKDLELNDFCINTCTFMATHRRLPFLKENNCQQTVVISSVLLYCAQFPVS